MSKLTNINMPKAILALVENAVVLNGESREEYEELLASNIESIGPTDNPEVLLVCEYTDCAWEQKSLDRARKTIINSRVNDAAAILLSEIPRWHADQAATPQTDRSLDAELAEYEIDRGTVLAKARVLARPDTADLTIEMNRVARRSDDILKILESRREILLHRQRAQLDALRRSALLDLQPSPRQLKEASKDAAMS